MSNKEQSEKDGVYAFAARAIDGREIALSQYRGKVLLIVNTASRCGFTPQYEGLQRLYDKYRQRGLEVLGFPCNQFAGQEPGAESEIAQSCKLNYGVSFQLFAKVLVNGDDAHPLYQYLKKACPGFLGGLIKWNFTKFLVDARGRAVERFAPTTAPEKLEPAIERLLAEISA